MGLVVVAVSRVVVIVEVVEVVVASEEVAVKVEVIEVVVIED